MIASARPLGLWLARRAENVAAAMLAAMFAAFLLQIVFRYALNLPIGWTHEISVILWVWLVLWGAAFVVTEREEIRFDIIYGAVGRPGTPGHVRHHRNVRLSLSTSCPLPAVIDYVTFMKVQSTAYLKIRFDLLYLDLHRVRCCDHRSIYLALVAGRAWRRPGRSSIPPRRVPAYESRKPVLAVARRDHRSRVSRIAHRPLDDRGFDPLSSAGRA